VTQILCSGESGHGGDRKTFEVMTLTKAIASMLAATLS